MHITRASLSFWRQIDILQSHLLQFSAFDVSYSSNQFGKLVKPTRETQIENYGRDLWGGYD